MNIERVRHYSRPDYSYHQQDRTGTWKRRYQRIHCDLPEVRSYDKSLVKEPETNNADQHDEKLLDDAESSGSERHYENDIEGPENCSVKQWNAKKQVQSYDSAKILGQVGRCCGSFGS